MKARVLKAGTVVVYNDRHVPNCVANGRRAEIVRCCHNGSQKQYVVEVLSCPENWKPEHKAQQVGKCHFWWECDFDLEEN